MAPPSAHTSASAAYFCTQGTPSDRKNLTGVCCRGRAGLAGSGGAASTFAIVPALSLRTACVDASSCVRSSTPTDGMSVACLVASVDVKDSSALTNGSGCEPMLFASYQSSASGLRMPLCTSIARGPCSGKRSVRAECGCGWRFARRKQGQWQHEADREQHFAPGRQLHPLERTADSPFLDRADRHWRQRHHRGVAGRHRPARSPGAPIASRQAPGPAHSDPAPAACLDPPSALRSGDAPAPAALPRANARSRWTPEQHCVVRAAVRECGAQATARLRLHRKFGGGRGPG